MLARPGDTATGRRPGVPVGRRAPAGAAQGTGPALPDCTVGDPERPPHTWPTRPVGRGPSSPVPRSGDPGARPAQTPPTPRPGKSGAPGPRLGETCPVRQRTYEELLPGIDWIREAPADPGRVEMIVRRPAIDQRELLEEGVLDEAVGLVSSSPYTLDLESDGNQRFVSEIMKNYNVIPGFYAAGLYVNCQVVDAGLKAAGGDASDKTKLMNALKGVSLTDTPRGPIKFDHLNNVVGAFYVRRIVKECAKYGLKLWNKTIKTYDNVSQFWVWPEQEYLAHPVYSRDFPALKKC